VRAGCCQHEERIACGDIRGVGEGARGLSLEASKGGNGIGVGIEKPCDGSVVDSVAVVGLGMVYEV